jgi:hypothetical protein
VKKNNFQQVFQVKKNKKPAERAGRPAARKKSTCITFFACLLSLDENKKTETKWEEQMGR